MLALYQPAELAGEEIEATETQTTQRAGALETLVLSAFLLAFIAGWIMDLRAAKPGMIIENTVASSHASSLSTMSTGSVKPLGS